MWWLALGALAAGVGIVEMVQKSKAKTVASSLLTTPAAGNPAAATKSFTIPGVMNLAAFEKQLIQSGVLDPTKPPPAESVEQAAHSKTPVTQKAIEEGYVNPYGLIGT